MILLRPWIGSASLAAFVFAFVACGGTAKPATSLSPAKGKQSRGKLLEAFPEKVGEGEDPLFPKTGAVNRGWSGVGSSQREKIEVFADGYRAFVSKARTQRQAAQLLLKKAQGAGALPLEKDTKAKAGQLYYWRDPSTSSVAFLRVGSEPIAEGLQILTASIDAGEIRLTPKPVYEKSGLALFDTSFLGGLQVEAWLNTPLVLHAYIPPSNSDGKGVAIAIGDEPDEPVFTIPDLLPHLSRKVQKVKLVDSPERMDAFAGFSSASVFKMLRRYGMSDNDFEVAEVSLLPAANPSYIGVDRGLLAADNHFARAIPYAAVDAIIGETPRHSSLVILMGHNRRSYAGAGADAHVKALLPLVVQAHNASADLLDLRRIFAKSRVLFFGSWKGTRNRGIVLNTRKDDATPAAYRHTLGLLDEALVPVQVNEEGGWSQAREVSSLDIDTIEFGLPISGVGTPYELLSILDLHSGLRACQAWLKQ